jgi:hypothetical protein
VAHYYCMACSCCLTAEKRSLPPFSSSCCCAPVPSERGYDTQLSLQIVMGTFIVSFIGNSFVSNTADAQLLVMVQPDKDARRRLLVVIYFAIIIAFITLFGVMTIPDIVREGADFIKRLKSDNVWVILVEKMRHGLG